MLAHLVVLQGIADGFFPNSEPIEYGNTPIKPEFCPMKILLVAATRFEIQPTLDEIEQRTSDWNGVSVDVLISGLGVVPLSHLLTKSLLIERPLLVIQAGIAGSFDLEKCPIGQTNWIHQDAFGDLGMETEGVFTPAAQSSFADPNAFPFTDGWLKNPYPWQEYLQQPGSKAVTVNKVTDQPAATEQLISAFSPQVESMEGAALHYVCLQEKIPFLQLRSISNAVGVRDKSQWNFPLAIEQLNATLQSVITQIPQMAFLQNQSI